ncbi:LVIVD repeat-containing protein [Actinokineospora spheciospongiae]|uniref:LVIVD repeat-containing protein n=1 Tax=Actinokineospora spheciospongiae TaxID=909613 RepID=UPI0015E86B36
MLVPSTRRLSATAVLGAAALTLSTLAGVTSASAQGAFPAADEIVTSPNVRHVANIPATAPLGGPSSVGTDLAFTGDYAIAGNYLGFTIYDIKTPERPRITSQVLCPGSQNDVSVSGNLLFLSTDSRRSDASCNSVAQNDGTKPYWEGIKVFDISDKRNPRYVTAVETACGSHTHTLVPGKKNKDVYLYVSSYSPAASLSKCQPPHDIISIVKVPLRDPASAALVATPNLFPDGGNPGRSGTIETGYTSATTGCHDITVFPAKDLAAGACMGDGVLMDISDREKPRVISRVQDDEHFAFWHSATFNNAGTKVLFTDELGGGGAATCNPEIGPTRGADGIYDITGRGEKRALEFKSFYKINRTQTDEENCVAHNGSLLPVPGRDIMVQAWYMGGVQIIDFTDSTAPKEIGFFERGPAADPDESGGVWSAYYYNGYIYTSDLGKGFDVLRIDDPRTDLAKFHRSTELNVQTQGTY